MPAASSPVLRAAAASMASTATNAAAIGAVRIAPAVGSAQPQAGPHAHEHDEPGADEGVPAVREPVE